MHSDDAECCASAWLDAAAVASAGSEAVERGIADILRGGTRGRCGGLTVALPGSVCIECLLSVCAELDVLCRGESVTAPPSLCFVSVSFFKVLDMSALT